MTDASTPGTGLNGALRLTWVTDQLQRVLQHSQTDELPGTWTGLACSSHGLELGADVDNATPEDLAKGQIADLIWEALPDFTLEHGQLYHAAIQAFRLGTPETGEQHLGTSANWRRRPGSS